MNRKRTPKGIDRFFILCAALSLALFSRCGKEAVPDLSVYSEQDVMVRVGTETVTVLEFELRFRNLPRETRESYEKPGGGGKKQFLQELVYEKLYSLEAREREFDKEGEIALQVKAATEKILADQLHRRVVVERVVGENAVNEFYKDNPSRFVEPTKYRLYEIGISPWKDSMITNASRDDAQNEVEAKAKLEFLLESLEKGEDFTELAKLFSEQSTAEVGGDLGYLMEKDLFPEQKKVVAKLKVGQVGEPIEVGGKYLLFQLSEKSPGGQLPFEEIREQLIVRFSKNKGSIMNAEADVLKEELERKYTVRYEEETVAKVFSR